MVLRGSATMLSQLVSMAASRAENESGSSRPTQHTDNTHQQCNDRQTPGTHALNNKQNIHESLTDVVIAPE